MKKVALCIAVVLYCTVMFSQGSKHSLGFEFSPTAISFFGDFYNSSQKINLGYSAGLTYRYRLNSIFSVKSGLTLDKKGTKTDIAVVDEYQVYLGKMGFRINYNYLVVPVMINLNDKKDHFFISSGPFIGYLVRALNKNDAFDGHPATVTNYTRDAEKLDFGWVLNLGYGFKVSDKLRLEFGIREDLGIKNLAEGGAVIRTNAVGFRIGIIML